MGIRQSDLDTFASVFAKKKVDPRGLKMMQFGDMGLRLDESRGSDYFRHHYEMEVVVIDINGEHDALPIDLSQVIKWPKYVTYFDIVTNYGTLEHIKDHEVGYANANYFLKQGGLLFVIAPLDGVNYRFHKRCHKYDPTWFVEWSEDFNYNVLVNRIIKRKKDDWVECVLEKR